MRTPTSLAVLAAALISSQAASAQPATPAAPAAASAQTTGNSSVELAKKLANPIASLISVPLQFNYNQGFAGGDGDQYYLNIQPVVPFSLNETWNLISRTILPIYSQDGVIPGEGSQFGFGPTTQSFFFSPKAPTANGLIWGVGPVALIPTATNDIAGSQWGLGVTGVALRQAGPWTVGGLANHIWSVSGNDRYGEISSTFLQPFINYTTERATSFFINTETTYDWENEQWSVPINFGANQLLTIGNRPVQIGGGLRYWVESPDSGPQDWGARFNVVFLFPR
jgi:hypothetical protein